MPKAVEVVAALIWRGDRFLACQRPAHKARGLLWEFVGGKVEPGETKEEALVRECREELGVTVRVGEVFTELTHVYPDLTVHLTLFHAAIPEESPGSWSTMTSAGSRWGRWTPTPSARRMRPSSKSSGSSTETEFLRKRTGSRPLLSVFWDTFPAILRPEQGRRA